MGSVERTDKKWLVNAASLKNFSSATNFVHSGLLLRALGPFHPFTLLRSLVNLFHYFWFDILLKF